MAGVDRFSTTWGSFSQMQVVKTEVLRSGADVFCLAHFAYQADLKPFLRPVLSKIEGMPTTEERKGRALLRHDPFSQQWKVLQGDFSNRNADFHSDSVGQYIRSQNLSR